MSARARVAKWGLRVSCLLCGREERHKPETEGRLRNRRSACHSAPMASTYWFTKADNAAKARARVIEARRQMRLFE